MHAYLILSTVPYLYIDSILVHSGSSNILMVKTFWLAGVFIDLQCDGTLKQDSFFCVCVCTSTCVPEDILVWAGQGRRVRGRKDVLNATDLLIKPALWMFLKLPLCHADYFSSLFFLQQNCTVKGGLHFGEYLISIKDWFTKLNFQVNK